MHRLFNRGRLRRSAYSLVPGSCGACVQRRATRLDGVQCCFLCAKLAGGDRGAVEQELQLRHLGVLFFRRGLVRSCSARACVCTRRRRAVFCRVLHDVDRERRRRRRARWRRTRRKECSIGRSGVASVRGPAATQRHARERRPSGRRGRLRSSSRRGPCGGRCEEKLIGRLQRKSRGRDQRAQRERFVCEHGSVVYRHASFPNRLSPPHDTDHGIDGSMSRARLRRCESRGRGCVQ